MRHVDDGTLHTYLDGALDSLGSAEAERVREHLASCEECARRLEEEAILREEATAVLAGAAPEVGDLPPFEDIRSRAAMARSSSSGWRIKQLAWAASMVIALGTGWMLRGASVPGGVEPAPAVEALRLPSEEPARPSLSPASAATTRAAGTEEVASGRMNETDVPDARRVVSAEAVETEEDLAEVPEEKTTDSLRALSDRFALEPVPATEGARGTLQRGRDSSLVGVALERRLITPEQLQPLGLRAAAEPGDAARQAARDLQPSARADAVPGEAEATEERSELPLSLSDASQPLVVPGLEVISVSWLTGADVDGAVRVLQRMERGDTLELIHLPPGVDPGSMSPVPADGRTEVVLPRGAGWLVARARLPRRDLEVILGQLTPAVR